MLYFISDIHGNRQRLNSRLATLPEDATPIQIGDYGLWPEFPYTGSMQVPLPFPRRPVLFCDGNHEYFPWLNFSEVTEVSKNSIFVPRGTVLELEGLRVGFLGGGDSIDKAWRTEGVSWFAEERITYEQGQRLLDNVGDKPLDVLVTHTPPAALVEHMLSLWGAPLYREFHGSALLVQQVWEQLGQPFNVSGHMHPERILRLGNAFCLPVDETISHADLLAQP